jgi:capsular polysaccharide biosynthesis protein
LRPATWDLSDVEPEDPGAVGHTQPTLVSLHFLRAALRRRRLTCLFSAVLGLMLGAAFLFAVPAPHTATATLVLAHDPGVDSALAMATDASLATTRSVAQRTIQQLHLTATPEQLLESVTAVATTSDLLVISVKGTSDAGALRTLTTFTKVFLAFRADQLGAQSEALIKGQQAEIDGLQGQIADLTQRINLLTGSGDTRSSELDDSISQRAQIGAQIGGLQQSVQDENLKSAALVASSRIIDAPAVTPGGRKRRLVLVLASGLIAGGAVGTGLVLFLAITSSRLRRRVDVASALGVPVAVSVRRLTPLRRPLRWLPWLRSIEARRAAERQRLVQTIEKVIPVAGRGRWLAVGCVDNADEVRYGLVAAALSLQRPGRTVRLIDLTAQGGLTAALEKLLPDDRGIRITVSRPRVIAALVKDLNDIDTFGPETREIPAWAASDVFLVLADLDPAVGAEHLTAWTETVVIAVTAGRSSAERVLTAGELVRSAGLSLACSVLLRSESTDESSGAIPLSGTLVEQREE